MRLLARYSTHLVALAVAPLLLLTRWAIAGRVWGVRVDLVYWEEAGNGFVPLPFALVSAAAGLVAVLVFLVQARRAWRHRWFWAAIAPLALLPALGMQRSPSRLEMARAAAAGTQLVAAIERYRQDEGEYPDSLAHLQGWGAAIPPTGLAAVRGWNYHAPDVRAKRRAGNLAATRNSYLLTLDAMPQGTLIYRPSHRYGKLPGRRLSCGWFCTTVD